MSEVIVHVFPGMMFMFLFFISQNAMTEIQIEDENHTLHRILSAPVSMNQFLFSKLLRCFLLGTVVMLTALGFTSLLFGMKLGNFIYLILAVLSSTFAVTGVLSIVYGLSRTKDQANALGTMVVMYFALTGGSMVNYEALPAFMQMLGKYSPNHWGIVAIQNVIRSRDFADLIQPITILLLMGGISVTFGFYFFTRKYRNFGTR